MQNGNGINTQIEGHPWQVQGFPFRTVVFGSPVFESCKCYLSTLESYR